MPKPFRLFGRTSGYFRQKYSDFLGYPAFIPLARRFSANCRSATSFLLGLSKRIRRAAQLFQLALLLKPMFKEKTLARLAVIVAAQGAHKTIKTLSARKERKIRPRSKKCGKISASLTISMPSHRALSAALVE